MNLVGSRPLITGASRGIGRAFVDAFLEAGAETVYACVRNDAAAARLAAADRRVAPVLLDTRNPAQVSEAAANDVSILVNNAGVVHWAGFLSAPTLEAAREEMEVNFFGPLVMARAFAPALIRNQGAIVNVLSIAALVHVPSGDSYTASKNAARSLVEGLRIDLGPKGVRVLAVYPGPHDTDMADVVEDKSILSPPSLLTSAVLGALADGTPDDIYPDERSQSVARMLGRLT